MLNLEKLFESIEDDLNSIQEELGIDESLSEVLIFELETEGKYQALNEDERKHALFLFRQDPSGKKLTDYLSTKLHFNPKEIDFIVKMMQDKYGEIDVHSLDSAIAEDDTFESRYPDDFKGTPYDNEPDSGEIDAAWNEAKGFAEQAQGQVSEIVADLNSAEIHPEDIRGLVIDGVNEVTGYIMNQLRANDMEVFQSEEVQELAIEAFQKWIPQTINVKEIVAKG